jgi:hypothetical protein
MLRVTWKTQAALKDVFLDSDQGNGSLEDTPGIRAHFYGMHVSDQSRLGKCRLLCEGVPRGQQEQHSSVLEKTALTTNTWNVPHMALHCKILCM